MTLPSKVRPKFPRSLLTFPSHHCRCKGPVINKVNLESPLEGIIFPGDIIVEVDDVDTREFSAAALTALLVRSANLRRKVVVLSEDVEGADSRLWEVFYNSALMDGSLPPSRIRLMMTGAYGVGKTSVVRSLQGKVFRPEYESTEGIDAVGRLDQSAIGSAHLDFHRALIKWRSSPSGREVRNTTTYVEDDDLLKDTEHVRSSPDKEPIKQICLSPEKVVVSDSISAEESDLARISLGVWDFAGQIVYHDMHQIFFRNNCLYLLVFNLQENNPLYTDDMMLSHSHKWLNAVVSTAGPSIKLIVVGTHGDSYATWDQAEDRLKALVANLEDRVSGIEYDEVLLQAPLVVVDNKTGRGVPSLRKEIETKAHNLLKQMDPIPLRWFRLNELIDGVGLEENQFCLSLSSVRTLARTTGMHMDKEITAALSFFDNIGDLIYVNTEILDQWVFSSPQLLLNAMTPLLAPQKSKALRCLTRSELDRFTKNGFLSQQSLTKVWEGCSFQDNEQLQELLVSFGILVKTHYGIVVPTRLPDTTSIVWPAVGNEEEVSFQLQCFSHAPPSLFSYLMAALYRLFGSVSQNGSELTMISRGSMCLALDEEKMRQFSRLGLLTGRIMLTLDRLRQTINLTVRTPLEKQNQCGLFSCISKKPRHDAILRISVIILTRIYGLVASRYPYLSLTTTVATERGGSKGRHVWSLPITNNQNSLPHILACSSTCRWGVKHTVADAVRVVPLGNVDQCTSLPKEAFLEPPSFDPADVERALALEPPPISSEECLKEKIGELCRVERPLIKWLAKLAALEVESGYKYKPSESELLWVRRIGLLYHRLVPLLQTYYKTRLDIARFAVFVSHTGADKDSYAQPLSEHLSAEGISTFLDRTSLPMGVDGNEWMLCAATTCSTMWCVTSKSFVKKWYPMRELLIGYTRFVRERHSFKLIMDCLETDHKKGFWIDEILKDMHSMRLYQESGELHDFPASMVRAIMEESFRQRYERIARQQLGNRGVGLIP